MRLSPATKPKKVFYITIIAQVHSLSAFGIQDFKDIKTGYLKNRQKYIQDFWFKKYQNSFFDCDPEQS